MIELGRHHDELIGDAHNWKPLNVSPAERLMVFENEYQSYVIHTAQRIVCVFDDDRKASNWYSLDESEFRCLMNELNLN